MTDRIKDARKLKAEAFSYSASLLAQATALDIAAGDLAKMANEITRLQSELSTWRLRAWLAMIGLAGTVGGVAILELLTKGA